MTETLYALIAMLSDGRFHSGEMLGKRLGIGRAAVWKSLQRLPALGLEFHAVAGRGYRLLEPIELLDESAISLSLQGPSKTSLSRLELFSVIDSTSQHIKQAAEYGAPSGTVCVAEYQSAGRGRRGRHWHSPYGSNIYFSVLWRFSDSMSRLGGLSLAMAVAMMRCFDSLGAKGIGIKWPNDIVSRQGKLAGILVDVAGESGGPCHAVIGIGVNYAMSRAVGSVIDQPWTHLCATGVEAGRNEVVARLLEHVFHAITLYERFGFQPFRDEWQRWDMLRDRTVSLHLPNESRDGIARGIDESGLLMVEYKGTIGHYASGEVSLRMAER
jgi:BirA family biotin operon repressor/biotin-[acetyl-CoA-carboxylase] ligase